MSKVVITIFDNDETQSVDLNAEFEPEFNEDSHAHLSAVLMIEALKHDMGEGSIREETKTFATEDDDDSEDDSDG